QFGRPKGSRTHVPKEIKQARFYVSNRIDANWFKDAHDYWCACYFVNLIRWRRITWRSNSEGFSQLVYRLLEKVIDRGVLRRIKQTLKDRGAIECDGKVAPGKALGYRITRDFSQDIHPQTCTDEKLNTRIARTYAREERDLLPVHFWLKHQLSKLVFDL